VGRGSPCSSSHINTTQSRASTVLQLPATLRGVSQRLLRKPLPQPHKENHLFHMRYEVLAQKMFESLKERDNFGN
jgi:hypothetical protein